MELRKLFSRATRDKNVLTPKRRVRSWDVSAVTDSISVAAVSSYDAGPFSADTEVL